MDQAECTNNDRPNDTITANEIPTIQNKANPNLSMNIKQVERCTLYATVTCNVCYLTRFYLVELHSIDLQSKSIMWSNAFDARSQPLAGL